MRYKRHMEAKEEALDIDFAIESFRKSRETNLIDLANAFIEASNREDISSTALIAWKIREFFNDKPHEDCVNYFNYITQLPDDIPAKSYLLGMAYFLGVGVKQNTGRAKFFLRKATKAGEPNATVELFEIYSEEREKDQAQIYLNQALEKNHPRAQWLAANHSLEKEELENAKTLFQKAAIQGMPLAKHNLFLYQRQNLTPLFEAVQAGSVEALARLFAVCGNKYQIKEAKRCYEAVLFTNNPYAIYRFACFLEHEKYSKDAWGLFLLLSEWTETAPLLLSLVFSSIAYMLYEKRIGQESNLDAIVYYGKAIEYCIEAIENEHFEALNKLEEIFTWVPKIFNLSNWNYFYDAILNKGLLEDNTTLLPLAIKHCNSLKNYLISNYQSLSLENKSKLRRALEIANTLLSQPFHTAEAYLGDEIKEKKLNALVNWLTARENREENLSFIKNVMSNITPNRLSIKTIFKRSKSEETLEQEGKQEQRHSKQSFTF
ncbi:sel1 repeat family protein [Coxiella burnetii]|uniref:Tetratricopeptide repeat family protein n=1 Tax=Coxiella burnetii (strain Dugway 5J108-111) TaxID=434922 RepID=A9KGS3_COXBN|nr:CBU_0295 family Dot/Icm type IV secretion system effector [Coxiella burnetii]ABS76863.2 hypothetical protein CBUD_1787 [Coxiella burnetii Dugway 5J108-111]OYK79652.1 sel1 repeat family protein [Coxiella burnetii]OYK81737.1 sel1 repeat family protein [Coxiella burnetii]